MREKIFIDTNILVYANDRREKQKQKKAQELLEKIGREDTPVFSGQVFQEFIHVARNKMKMKSPEIIAQVNLFSKYEVVPITAALSLRALEICDIYQVSFWDGAIIAAAETAGCSLCYSEDLNSGQVYGSVEVVDPFA